MKQFLLLSLLFAIIGSCAKEANKNSIDSDILVSAVIYNDQLVIVAETVKEYETEDYKIIYGYMVMDDRILIEFVDIEEPDTAAQVFEPAQCFIPIQTLEAGTYEIEFELNEAKTTGQLIVGNDVILNLEPGGNVKPL